MKKYDVFISYKSKDVLLATKIREALEVDGLRCWMAPDSILPGEDYASAIPPAIKSSKIVVLVATAEAYESKHVRSELSIAFTSYVRIIPFKADSTLLPENCEYFLALSQWLDASSNPEQHIGDLVKAVRHHIPKEAQTTPDPSPKPEPKPAPTPKPMVKPAVRSYKVGDYYNENGKEGVVFWVDATGRHGKIVSLDYAKLPWCTEVQLGRQIFIGAESSTEGKLNTDIVMARADREEYPAFMWCREKGADWYLPAKEELRELSEVETIVSETMWSKGGKNLSGWYWSSSEDDEFCAWGVGMPDGYTYRDLKYYNSYVRAVSAF